MFTHDTASFLLSFRIPLLWPPQIRFITRVASGALNTVELTHSGLPDREQLVSIRLNSLRPLGCQCYSLVPVGRKKNKNI